MSRRPPPPFTFDNEYAKSKTNNAVHQEVPSAAPKPRPGPRSLVPFFADEPIDSSDSRADWVNDAAPEEDLREGMDDYE